LFHHTPFPPAKPPLVLGKTWRHLGRKQTLTPGLYRWFRLTALGTRAQPRFRSVLDSSTFGVKSR
jgi:hypothetical protein